MVAAGRIFGSKTHRLPTSPRAARSSAPALNTSEAPWSVTPTPGSPGVKTLPPLSPPSTTKRAATRSERHWIARTPSKTPSPRMAGSSTVWSAVVSWRLNSDQRRPLRSDPNRPPPDRPAEKNNLLKGAASTTKPTETREAICASGGAGTHRVGAHPTIDVVDFSKAVDVA